MVSCPRCGRQNLPSATACSQCGATLPAAMPIGAPVSDGAEEYARQMAAREAVRRRNRMLIGAVALRHFLTGQSRRSAHRAETR